MQHPQWIRWLLSRSWKETGLPRERIQAIRRGVSKGIRHPSTSQERTKLRNTYQRLQYQKLRATGFSREDAQKMRRKPPKEVEVIAAGKLSIAKIIAERNGFTLKKCLYLMAKSHRSLDDWEKYVKLRNEANWYPISLSHTKPGVYVPVKKGSKRYYEWLERRRKGVIPVKGRTLDKTARMALSAESKRMVLPAQAPKKKYTREEYLKLRNKALRRKYDILRMGGFGRKESLALRFKSEKDVLKMVDDRKKSRRSRKR